MQGACEFGGGAHPHVCGEHEGSNLPAACVQGSSPRMRGTRLYDGVHILAAGLIPTYAGNTLWFVIGVLPSWAHPHVCGEHARCCVKPLRRVGSSPRMRGTLDDCNTGVTGVGLIPTYAGNTIKGTKCIFTGWAHPHVCGEHIIDPARPFRVEGSSPRMRGTLWEVTNGYSRRGLIPTYAGNTSFFLAMYRRNWAHPHVCGEHRKVKKLSTKYLGSSPRMRGTLVICSVIVELVGLIPTYAGNTKTPLSQDRDSRAHPHVCGEHGDTLQDTIVDLGSSPRMRGTPLGGINLHARVGLIPTYAGNT